MKPSNTTKYIFIIIATILGATFFLVSMNFMSGYRKDENLAILFTILLMVLYGFSLYRSYISLKSNRVGLAYFLTIGGFLLLSFLEVLNCASATQFMH